MVLTVREVLLTFLRNGLTYQVLSVPAFLPHRLRQQRELHLRNLYSHHLLLPFLSHRSLRYLQCLMPVRVPYLIHIHKDNLTGYTRMCQCISTVGTDMSCTDNHNFSHFHPPYPQLSKFFHNTALLMSENYKKTSLTNILYLSRTGKILKLLPRYHLAS